HEPRRPLLAKIRPGSPAPTMGPGTADGADGSHMVTVIGAEHKTALAQHPFNSVNDWHFEILFIVAIVFHLTHICSRFMATNSAALKAHLRDATRYRP